MRLDIVIPAHNEKSRIDKTLHAYRAAVNDPLARFLVAMDSCTDRTAEVVSSHSRVDGRVEAHEFPKLGKGGVLMESFRRCDGDLVGFVDADGATPPAEFLRLVEAAEGADGAIASRTHPASVLPVRRPLARRAASRAFMISTQALFGLPFTDTQCGAKVVGRHVVDRVLPLLSSRDFLFDVDLLWTADRLGFHIVEVPTVWLDQAGSRLSAGGDATRMATSSLRLWLHHRVLPLPQPQPQLRSLESASSEAVRDDQQPSPARAGQPELDGEPGAVSSRRPRMPITDVTIVSPYPSVDQTSALPSGVAYYTERLAAALADAGLGVRVVAPKLDGDPEIVRVGGVTVERRYRPGASALPVAAAAARRTGSPLVHLQHEVFLYGGPPSIPGLVPALAVLRGDGLGPVVTMHQVVDPAAVDHHFTQIHRVQVPPSVARAGLAGVQRSVHRLAAMTIVHQSSFGRILPEAAVVPCGLDLSDRLPAGEARRSLGLGDGRLVVLCFGFLAPYKGLESALDAAEVAGPAVELVVAGGEHPRLSAGRDPYSADLKARYGEVARFTGYVPEQDVAAWFSAADVVVLPYPRPFASSGPFAQALGFGTPVLVSPPLAGCLDAPPEMVLDLDPERMAGQWLALAANPERLEALRSLTRSLATDRTWEKVAKRHIDLYEEVLDANRTAGRRLRAG